MKDSALVRFLARTIVVAVLTYVVDAFKVSDPITIHGVAVALVTSAGYAVIGLVGPQEPFVGIKYAAEVPVPPAEPER